MPTSKWTRAIIVAGLLALLPSCATEGTPGVDPPETEPFGGFGQGTVPDGTGGLSSPDAATGDPSPPGPETMISAEDTTEQGDIGPAPVEDAGGPEPPDAVAVLPDPGLRYVRVVTEESPSWVSWFEVEVYGTWAGVDGEPSNLALGKPAQASEEKDYFKVFLDDGTIGRDGIQQVEALGYFGEDGTPCVGHPVRRPVP